jgi:ferritin-like metal-binding protein YciE
MKTMTPKNRTGISTAIEEAEKTASGAIQATPSAAGDVMTLGNVRDPYISEHELVGSRPLVPGSKIPDIFMDKLGDRLAFERSGTRLYQLMFEKVQLNNPILGGPSPDDIEHIMREEHQHFQLLSKAIQMMGGDPTVQTPLADLTGVANEGLVQVMADPRTTVPQCLHVLLTAELLDNDCWEMLITLARRLGQNDMATQFQQALQNEKDHLQKVRGWMTTATEIEAKADGAVSSQTGHAKGKAGKKV